MLRISRVSLHQMKKYVGKPSDNTPLLNDPNVEWFPRQLRLSVPMVEDMQQWAMRQQLDGSYDELNDIRKFHRNWGNHPMKPALGDREPTLPKGVKKPSHRIYRTFVKRWHRANAPDKWMWLPRDPAPWHHADGAAYPERWREIVASSNRRRASPASAAGEESK